MATTVAELVRQARELAGLSQIEVAEKCGVHPTTIAKIESGDRFPGLLLAGHLSNALRVDRNELLGLLMAERQQKRTEQSVEHAVKTLQNSPLSGEQVDELVRQLRARRQ